LIDIHCHILPGVDDGPAVIEASLDMAEIAAGDGITHIIATPHFRYDKGPSLKDIERVLEIFGERVRRKGIPLTLLAGADIALTYELADGVEKNDIPTVGGSRYFLLELPDHIPPGLDIFLLKARLKGYVPVITHPERNPSLLLAPEKVEALRAAGVLFQVTAMSFTGGFGPRAAGFSRMLCRKGFVDFVASDAHDTGRRRPVLSGAFREISRLVGDRTAGKIFFENPEALLKNAEVRAAV
jgi:protein-tyrosine phosphatase